MRNFNNRRVLFDTDAIIDAIDTSRPEHAAAQSALKFCNGGGDLGLVTAGSLKDVYYILRKNYGKSWARNAIKHMLSLLVVLPLEAESTIIAAESSEPDFEDALVRAAAELNHVSFILTRDKTAFKCSTVRAITCSEYLEIIVTEGKHM